MKRRTAETVQSLGQDCLAGGGEMGELMRSHDWSTTPFGPVEGWPQSLRTAISLMLASRFAMVIAWGPDFRFFYNDRYRPVLGSTKHPGALGTPAQITFPEAWPQIGPLFESTRQGESVSLDDMLIPLDRNGYLENCYFTLSYSPIRDETGGVGGMLAVVAETTERVEGERRLKTLRDLARRAADAKTARDACINAGNTLAENLIDVPFALLYLIAADGKTARLECAAGIARGGAASPETVDLSVPSTDGWPLAEVVDNGSTRVVDNLAAKFGPMPGGPYPEHAHSALLVPLLRPGQPRPDGVIVFGISPRRALDDQYRAFYELAADHILTAIRNAIAHQDERERAERLAALDRAKTAFFSNVSHEFRTPLTLMLGPLEDTLARADKHLHPHDHEQLSLVHRNSLRLLKLVNTLLDFSRIESGRIEAVYEPVDLARYTSELASVFRSAVERAGMRLVVDCPPLAEDIYVDKEMWEKIVLNLISNAFKFTFEGVISVRLYAGDGNVKLEIKDTGTGIPEEELPHLFERFHRIRGARARTHEGSGIGLALVHELVNMHAGTISVASKLEHGTTFTITIPMGTAHLAADRVKAVRRMTGTAIGAMPFVEEALRWIPDSPGSQRKSRRNNDLFGGAESDLNSASLSFANGGKPRILLADDNSDMRDYLKTLFEQDYHVEAVADGATALAAARSHTPDLILSDVMMPEMDGFELLRELRGDHRTQFIPVIMLSARAGEESRVEGLAAGADDYLVKPFSTRELLARVKAHVDLNRMRQETRRQIATILESITDGFIALDTQWRFTYINHEAREVFQRLQRAPGDLINKNLWHEFPDLVNSNVYVELMRAVTERAPVTLELYYPPLTGWFEIHAYPSSDGLSIYVHEITVRRLAQNVARENTEILETINRVGELLVGELDIHKLVQAVTDAATELTGAQFGSFFYNVLDRSDQSYMLYALSGVPEEAIANFTMSRITNLFGPTFRGDGVVRMADVKQDSRYGKTSPYYEIPKDHLSVVSYMAVPVISRSGEVLGGLFFGHPEPDVFSERDEKIVIGLAGQSAIAIDNARLFEKIEKEGHRAALLAEASETLTESLDYEETLTNLANIAVQSLADWCVIDVVNDRGEISRIASAHKDPTKEELLSQLKELYTPDWNSPQPSARVLRTGDSELLAEVTDDLLAQHSRSARHMDLLKEIGVTSHIAVALVARGNKLGVINLGLSEGSRRFGRDDLKLAEELGRRAAFAVDNARLYRTAQDANRMKDEFLATVSHELRTPLSAVLGWARVLRTAKLDADGASKALEAIERNAKFQAQLIEDLLDVSRIISGKLRLNVQPIEVSEVIEAAIDAVRPAADAKQIRIQTILDRPGGVVLADATRLQQVFWNLLSNAIKFTPKDGRVQVKSSLVNSHLEIAISDSGQGISAAFLPHVFDRFRQADSSSARRHGGLGLGLAIVLHLVEMHGGLVRAASPGQGKGATFTVSLPVSISLGLGDAQTRAFGESIAGDALISASMALDGIRVLIVDDEADAREFLCAVIGQHGAVTMSAASASEALDIITRSSPAELPDVLVSDIGMPNEDGYSLIRKLRALPPEQGGKINAVALTAYAHFEDRMRALASGFQMHVAKPIEPAELIMVIKSLTARAAGTGD